MPDRTRRAATVRQARRLDLERNPEGSFEVSVLQGRPPTRPLAAVRGRFVRVGLFSLFINIAMLALPLYMLQVYDRVLTSGSTDTLVMLTVLCGGLLLAMALVGIARSWLLTQVSNEVDAALNGILFTAAIRGGDAAGSAPLRDLETLRRFLTSPGLLAFFDAPWTPLFLAILFAVHPLFGLIASFGALLILLLTLRSEYATRAPARDAGTASRKAHDLVDSLSRNTAAIQAMGMAGHLRSIWQRHHAASVGSQGVAADRAAVLGSFARLVRMSLQIAILGTGAWLAINRIVTPGAMIAASIIMGRALAPIEAAIGSWRGFVEARAAHRRLASVLSVQPEATARRVRLPAPEGRLVAEEVSMRLALGGPPVLQNVSFALEPGETLGVIGPSGAGKSTLARLLVGLAKPSFGRVTLDGVELCDWPKEEVGPHLGYVPQEVELLDGTVGENIARFGDLDSAEIVAAAQLAGAHDVIVSLPQGYETRLSENGRSISGGQRQRIALARAVCGDVRLVVLDEANANLDAQGETALRELIAGLEKRGRTVVVISHTPSILRIVDKLLVLQDGRMQAFGARDDVLAGRIAPVAARRIAGRGHDDRKTEIGTHAERAHAPAGV